MKEKDEKLWNKVAGRSDNDRADALIDHLKSKKKLKEPKKPTHHQEDFHRFLHKIGIHRSDGRTLRSDMQLHVSITKCIYCEKLMVSSYNFTSKTLLKVIAFLLSWVGLGFYAFFESSPIKYLIIFSSILGLIYILFKQVSECS
jgi:hypothetical protein